MMPMAAPVISLPPNAQQESVDFLRRLSSMLTGGRNAEMLQTAGATALRQALEQAHGENLLLRRRLAARRDPAPGP